MTRTADRRPPLIGLTGVVGAGKSAALEAFARLGCAVLQTDRVVHELYARPDVRDAVAACLGPGVLAADGTIDRPAVGRIVFADPDALAWLEGLIHPLVGEEVAAWVARERRRRPAPRALVCEVPLLFEGGGADRYDTTVVVTAPPALRRARLAERGALAGAAAREARQLDQDGKRARAHAEIANDGDREALAAAVGRYLDRVAPS